MLEEEEEEEWSKILKKAGKRFQESRRSAFFQNEVHYVYLKFRN